MSNLEEALVYLLSQHRGILPASHAAKLMYLADWMSSLKAAKQITAIRWAVGHGGPAVEPILDAAMSSPRFAVETTGDLPDEATIRLVNRRDVPSLASADEETIDRIVEIARRKPWEELVSLVYSTYPAATQPRYMPLDLVSLAARYQTAMRAIEQVGATKSASGS